VQLDHQSPEAFGDALVILGVGDLRLRALRDRDQILADFGSAADPTRYFDSAVVIEYLG
jgi:hypothetical protein